MKILFYILFFLFFSGCNNQKDQEKNYFNFPEVYYLKGHLVEKTDLGLPTYMYKFDTLLFILDRKPLDGKYIQLFNMNNFMHVASGAFIGRGPGEINNPANPGLDYLHKIIWIQDWSSRRIYRFSLDSILLNENYHPQYFFKIPVQIFPPRVFSYYKDGLFTMLGMGKDMICFMDTTGNILNDLSVPNKLDAENYNSLSSSVPYVYRYFPSHERILVYTNSENIFYIIDNDGNIIRKITGRTLYHPVNESGLNKVMGFCDVRIGKKNIYFEYLGKQKGYFDKKTHKPVTIFPKEIYVFNHNGEPVARFVLDHPISRYCLDEKRNRIIAFTMNKNISLIYYNLPENLLDR